VTLAAVLSPVVKYHGLGRCAAALDCEFLAF
jgi:hypothetical protein